MKTTIISGDAAEAPEKSIVFTPENWQKWVSVKIGALADGIEEGPHLGVVSHVLISTDLNYNGSVTHGAACGENTIASFRNEIINASVCEPIQLPVGC